MSDTNQPDRTALEKAMEEAQDDKDLCGRDMQYLFEDAVPMLVNVLERLEKSADFILSLPDPAPTVWADAPGDGVKLPVIYGQPVALPASVIRTLDPDSFNVWLVMNNNGVAVASSQWEAVADWVAAALNARADHDHHVCRLLDLLAVLNGDGGQYANDHGIESAIKRAVDRYYEGREAFDHAVAEGLAVYLPLASPANGEG